MLKVEYIDALRTAAKEEAEARLQTAKGGNPVTLLSAAWHFGECEHTLRSRRAFESARWLSLDPLKVVRRDLIAATNAMCDRHTELADSVVAMARTSLRTNVVSRLSCVVEPRSAGPLRFQCRFALDNNSSTDATHASRELKNAHSRIQIMRERALSEHELLPQLAEAVGTLAQYLGDELFGAVEVREWIWTNGHAQMDARGLLDHCERIENDRKSPGADALCNSLSSSITAIVVRNALCLIDRLDAINGIEQP